MARVLTDAGTTIGLKFVPDTLTITSGPVAGSDLHVSTDSATLMSTGARTADSER